MTDMLVVDQNGLTRDADLWHYNTTRHQGRHMKRITRDRRLTPEEAAKYKGIREQVAEELPDLIARHHERTAGLDQLDQLVGQLKAAREEKGLSLADLTELTGMDRSALSKLETGQRANPTVETLVRYAEAVGKRLVVSLTDA
jgi:DNA-binding XRE family transcriptional regulator